MVFFDFMKKWVKTPSFWVFLMLLSVVIWLITTGVFYRGWLVMFFKLVLTNNYIKLLAFWVFGLIIIDLVYFLFSIGFILTVMSRVIFLWFNLINLFSMFFFLVYNNLFLLSLFFLLVSVSFFLWFFFDLFKLKFDSFDNENFDFFWLFIIFFVLVLFCWGVSGNLKNNGLESFFTNSIYFFFSPYTFLGIQVFGGHINWFNFLVSSPVLKFFWEGVLYYFLSLGSFKTMTLIFFCFSVGLILIFMGGLTFFCGMINDFSFNYKFRYFSVGVFLFFLGLVVVYLSCYGFIFCEFLNGSSMLWVQPIKFTGGNLMDFTISMFGNCHDLFYFSLNNIMWKSIYVQPYRVLLDEAVKYLVDLGMARNSSFYFPGLGWNSARYFLQNHYDLVLKIFECPF